MKRKMKSEVGFEIKSLSEDGTFEGYGAIFGNVDFGNDVIAPGAFKNSIKELSQKKRKLVVLWQHDTTQPIGVFDEISEDEIGLRVKGRLLLETEKGREAYAMLKAEAITGLSIGYGTIKSSRDEKTGVRTLKELALYEVSLVTFPMNDEARIDAVKQSLDDGELPTIREFEKFLRDAGFSKKQAADIADGGLKKLLRDAKDEGEEKTESDVFDKVSEALKSFSIPKMEK